MNQDQQAPQPDTIPCDDLNSFVRMLTGWHSQQCAVIQQLLAVPEGSVFEIGEGDEAQTIELNSENMAAFKFGIEMVMMQLGTLPFVAELEVDEAANEAAVNAAG